jgi:hypothetical protein
MSISKLIQEQADFFAAIDKRFAAGLTGKDFQQRIASITEDREKQIVERIKALETQKAADISRYDIAIETEKKALEDLKARRIDPNPKPRPKPDPRPDPRPAAQPVRPAGPEASKPKSAKPVAGRSAPASKAPVKNTPTKPKPA